MRFHHGEAIRTLLPDLRKMCFAFSPDYLAAIGRRRDGAGGVFSIETEGSTSFVPAVMFKHRFLTLATLVSPPRLLDGGILDPECEAASLEALVLHLRQSGRVHRVTQPANWCLFQCAPHGAVSAPFGSYVLPLSGGSDVAWRGLHQKHRNIIRNAMQAGVEVREGAGQLDACLALYQSTMARNRMSHEPRALLEAMMGSGDFDVFCGVAHVEGEAVAALFAPYNTRGAYYLFGGTAEEMRVNGANNLLHFEAIRAFAERGVGFYDFVGARLGDVQDPRLQGIQRFKARFGAPLRRGVLWKQDLSPWRCRGQDAVVSTRNLLSGRRRTRDIVDQERAP